MSGESEKRQEIGGAHVELSVSSENEMVRVHHSDFRVLKYGAIHTPVSCQLVILAQFKNISVILSFLINEILLKLTGLNEKISLEYLTDISVPFIFTFISLYLSLYISCTDLYNLCL